MLGITSHGPIQCFPGPLYVSRESWTILDKLDNDLIHELSLAMAMPALSVGAFARHVNVACFIRSITPR
jgi:hypothetical protein